MEVQTWHRQQLERQPVLYIETTALAGGARPGRPPRQRAAGAKGGARAGAAAATARAPQSLPPAPPRPGPSVWDTLQASPGRLRRSRPSWAPTGATWRPSSTPRAASTRSCRRWTLGRATCCCAPTQPTPRCGPGGSGGWVFRQKSSRGDIAREGLAPSAAAPLTRARARRPRARRPPGAQHARARRGARRRGAARGGAADGRGLPVGWRRVGGRVQGRARHARRRQRQRRRRGRQQQRRAAKQRRQRQRRRRRRREAARAPGGVGPHHIISPRRRARRAPLRPAAVRPEAGRYGNKTAAQPRRQPRPPCFAPCRPAGPAFPPRCQLASPAPPLPLLPPPPRPLPRANAATQASPCWWTARTRWARCRTWTCPRWGAITTFQTPTSGCEPGGGGEGQRPRSCARCGCRACSRARP
jgi:hypothetical protein